MKKSTGSITIFIAIAVMITLQSCVHKQHNDDLKIWYRDPANALVPDLMEGWRNDTEWLKAFPVGNGFMSGMVFGDVNMERIQLMRNHYGPAALKITTIRMLMDRLTVSGSFFLQVNTGRLRHLL